jgi:hypothetical protein
MSEPEDGGSREVTEAYASGAGLQLAEAPASGEEIQAAGAQASSAGNQSSTVLDDCIITGITSANTHATDSKLSIASVLSAHDLRLIRDREEMINEKRREIASRYEKLRTEATENLQQFLSQNPLSAPPSTPEEFFRIAVQNFKAHPPGASTAPV